MAIMGQYCKAYLLKDFRRFNGWAENPAMVRKETKVEDGQEVEVERTLTDDAILYLQENYVVTDGIFKDENIIFDQVTPEWTAFCQEELEFEIPEYATPSPPETPEES